MQREASARMLRGKQSPKPHQALTVPLDAHTAISPNWFVREQFGWQDTSRKRTNMFASAARKPNAVASSCSQCSAPASRKLNPSQTVIKRKRRVRRGTLPMCRASCQLVTMICCEGIFGSSLAGRVPRQVGCHLSRSVYCHRPFRVFVIVD